ncbi:MAG: hypothetical protein ABSA31_06775 [Acidimicrobiales bacterium]|jgi:hypothetical protein
MKGRWAAGIVPRNFAWIIKGHLAVSERPGGSAPDHRRVRRQEEIFWLRAQGFTRVVSLLPSTHNLHAYEELGLEHAHVPMGAYSDIPAVLGDLYPKLLGWLHAGERILVHQDELGDRLAGVFAGFLWWSGMIPEPPLAISAIEHLLRRQLGSVGRKIATQAMEVPLPPEEDRRHPAPPPEETVVDLRPDDGEPIAPAAAPARGTSPRAPVPASQAPGATVAPVADLASRRPARRARRSPEGNGPPPGGPRKLASPAPGRASAATREPRPGASRTPAAAPGPKPAPTVTPKRVPHPAKTTGLKPAPKGGATTARGAKAAGRPRPTPAPPRRRRGSR